MPVGKNQLTDLRERLLAYRESRLLLAAVRRARGLKSNAVRRERKSRQLAFSTSEMALAQVRYKGQAPMRVTFLGGGGQVTVLVGPQQSLMVPVTVAQSWMTTQPDTWEYANG